MKSFTLIKICATGCFSLKAFFSRQLFYPNKLNLFYWINFYQHFEPNLYESYYAKRLKRRMKIKKKRKIGFYFLPKTTTKTIPHFSKEIMIGVFCTQKRRLQKQKKT